MLKLAKANIKNLYVGDKQGFLMQIKNNFKRYVNQVKTVYSVGDEILVWTH
jgi:hypothetical protein